MGGLKILLVEDAPEVQLMVKSALAKKFDLTCVSTAEEAQRELAREHYSLLILDVALPGEDGFKLCANIRNQEKYAMVPIVFLTGKNQTRDKVMAFSLGADDYVVKPLDLEEFQARITAKMKRIQMSAELQNRYTHGPFEVALAEQKIFVDVTGTPQDLELSSIEFKLFYYFLRHEDHVLSREQILNAVWGHNTHVTDRAVDTYVYSLRKKLGAFGRVLISVPRVGYKMSLSEMSRTA